MKEPTTEEVKESMRKLLEENLLEYTENTSITLASYLISMRTTEEEEGIGIIEELYNKATKEYLKILNEARRKVKGKPLLPLIMAHTYFLAYLHCEMSTSKEWADFFRTVMEMHHGEEAQTTHDPAYQ